MEFRDKAVKSYWLAINQPARPVPSIMPSGHRRPGELPRDCHGHRRHDHRRRLQRRGHPAHTDGTHVHLALEGGGVGGLRQGTGSLAITMPGGVTVNGARMGSRSWWAGRASPSTAGRSSRTRRRSSRMPSSSSAIPRPRRGSSWRRVRRSGERGSDQASRIASNRPTFPRPSPNS